MSQLGQLVNLVTGVTSLTGDSGAALTGALKIKGGNNITTAAAGTDITVNVSGTTNHAIQLGNVGGSLSSLAVGATGTVLIGTTGADPSFSASPTVTTMYATTFDTNVTAAGVTLSGTTLSADGTDANIDINITAKGTGQVIIDDLQLATDLAVQYGGTGASTLLDHGVLVGSGTAAIDALAVGLTGTLLTGVSGSDPTWTTTTYPSTTAIGDVLIATAANTISAVTGAATAGYVLMANGAATSPTFQALPASGIQTLAGDSGTATGSTVTIAGGTNLTSVAGTATVTINLDDAITLSTVNATTFDTNVVAAGTTLSGTTWAADGTDTNITMTITPKGTGALTLTSGNINLPVSNSANTTGCIYINGIRYFSANRNGSSVVDLALGYEAGLNNAANSGNMAIGYRALKLDAQGGSGNFACGINALAVINSASGYYNAAMATASMQNMTSGFQNCGLGRNSLGNIVYGNNNVAMGDSAGSGYTGNSAVESNNICIGSQVLGTAGEANTIRIGNGSSLTHSACYIGGIYSASAGATAKVALIDSASKLAGLAGAASTILVGGTAPSFTATPSCTDLTLTGVLNLPASNAAFTAGTININSVRMITQGTSNTNVIIGYDAGQVNNTTHTKETFIGYQAGRFASTSPTTDGGGSENVAIGYYSMGAGPVGNHNSNCSGNTAVGAYTLQNMGWNAGAQTAIGYKAGQVLSTNTCNRNTIVGYQGLYLATAANDNCIFGDSCADALTSGANALNCFIGASSATNMTTGDVKYNTFVGGSSGAVMTSGNIQYNTFIGYQSGYSYPAASVPTYCINIGSGVSGTGTESYITRIGQTTGGSAQTACYVGGIYGVTPGGTKNIALIDSNGQLGSAATIAQSYLSNGLTWNNSTSTPVTAAVNNEYTINTASGLTTINLPSTFAVNDRIKIVGSGVDGWTLVANAGDTIQFGSTPTSSGGSISSTVRYDSIEVVGIVADTTWNVICSVGTLTVA